MPVRMLALSLAMLLAGCTEYRYIDPQTPEGLACKHELDAKVSACETRFKEQQEGLNSLRETQASFAQQCEHFNKNNTPNACPPAPSPSTVSSPCRNGYAEKYKACGGRIETVEK